VAATQAKALKDAADLEAKALKDAADLEAKTLEKEALLAEANVIISSIKSYNDEGGEFKDKRAIGRGFANLNKAISKQEDLVSAIEAIKEVYSTDEDFKNFKDRKIKAANVAEAEALQEATERVSNLKNFILQTIDENPLSDRVGLLYETDDKADAVTEDGTNKITNVGEVPYDNPTFLKINTPGRDWIYRYTLALSKELLAYVRGKYQTVPVPGSEATLNQADLLTDARAEKEKLLSELSELLQVASRTSQLKAQAEETDAMNQTLKGVPMTIFVG